jgi:hypothetical protein
MELHLNLYLRSGEYSGLFPFAINPSENCFQNLYPAIPAFIENASRVNPDRIFVSDLVALLQVGHNFWLRVIRDRIPVYAEGFTSFVLSSIYPDLIRIPSLTSDDMKKASAVECFKFPQFRVDYFATTDAVVRNSWVFDKYFVFNLNCSTLLSDNVVCFNSSGLSHNMDYFAGRWVSFTSLFSKLAEISKGRNKLTAFVSVPSLSDEAINLASSAFIKSLDSVKKSYRISIHFYGSALSVNLAALLKFKCSGVSVTHSDSLRYPVRDKLLRSIEAKRVIIDDYTCRTNLFVNGADDVLFSDNLE